jgi:lysophospholipase L1-like esterase
MAESRVGTLRWREWGIRLTLMGLSLLFALAVAEGVARVLRAGQHGGKEGREDAAYKEYDPTLGWRKKKNTSATYKRREYTVEVRMNSQGLRDPERSIEPRPGTFRVLALGDSFVEGYTVDLAQTVTQRLEGRLNAAGCSAEVINGGTSAYSTDQEFLFYETDGARYRPSLVLLFFFWNDVVYSDRQDYFGTPKPVFQMGGGDLRLHRYPVKEKPMELAPPAAANSEDQASGSALVELVRERLWVSAPALHNRLAGLRLWDPIPKMTPRLEMLVYDRRDLAVIEDAWEKVGAILAALKRRVNDRGSRLGIVYVPSLMEIQETSFQATKDLYRLKEDAWDPMKVRNKLIAMGNSLGVPVIDLGPSLSAATKPLRPTYFTFDVHWNGRGHDVASSAVFDWMRETRSLPPSCGGDLKTQAATAFVWDPATGTLPR